MEVRLDEIQLLRAEIERLRTEIRELKERYGENDPIPTAEKLTISCASPQEGFLLTAPAVHAGSSPEEKVGLFRNLFRGREDVYALRWEGKDGRSGYAPSCAHEWDRFYCSKPRIKCAACAHREYRPLTDEVVTDHLSGKKTIGVYAMLPDETCRFLAADFDGPSWKEDVEAFIESCRHLEVPASVERSRSGNGAHVWILFAEPLSAGLARKLGFLLVTLTMDRRPELGLKSYDRFFPSQDTLPKGGFGNLVALPLQKEPREKGNSIFLCPSGEPWGDQWAFLSSVRKMNLSEVEAIVRDALRQDAVIGVRLSLSDEDEGADPWISPSAGVSKKSARITGPLPKQVRAVMANMLFIEKEGVPASLLNRLVRLAAFQNPEFFRAQAMRLSTYDKPRVISCAQEFPRHIGLPRGCREDVQALLEANGITLEMIDERQAGALLGVIFRGTLNQPQECAAQALCANDIGILSAATAFGKTVIGARMIAERGVSTLVLVHRRQLLDQWRERLNTFLEMAVDGAEKGEKLVVGEIGGGKHRPTGLLDVALMQSIGRAGEVDELVNGYGHIIVDECHHLSAFTFEQILRKARARFVLGLTATPFRKDGHHPIIIMQCGPIRFRTTAKTAGAGNPVEHVVVPRFTDYALSPSDKEPVIQEIYASLVGDERRNDMIFNDIMLSLESGRSPILLTERTEHLEYFSGRLKNFAKNIIVLRGGMGRRQRKEIAQRLASIPDDEERLLLATGRYIGEGFDDARLDTLFLALPISWRGTLQQYAGRLHRAHAGKRVVQIYDYVDEQVPVLARMYRKRLRGYRAMGYVAGNLVAPATK